MTQPVEHHTSRSLKAWSAAHLLLFTHLFFSTTACAQGFQVFLNRVTAAPVDQQSAIVDSFMNAVGNLPMREQDTLAHFIYRGNATSVTVPGDANGWNVNGNPMTRLASTDCWFVTCRYESDARLDYKFVLNGSTWILDPRNPYQVSGGYGPNSELRMPTYIPPSEILYVPSIPHGTLRDTTWFSTNLGNSRTIRIYTPPTYVNPADSFPVVLVHDGLEYVTLAQMNYVLDNLIAQNRIPPIIAVFVPPVNRTNEYAGSSITQFSAFVVNELMPYIDTRYRTQKHPSRRAVLGASNGGNISLWLACNYPGVFGNVAAQSSNIISSISAGFQNNPKLDVKLYLDIGTYDIAQLIPLVKNFVPVLQAKGYAYRYNEFHEGHSWGNWRAHIDDALEFFFPGPALSVAEEKLLPAGMQLLQNYPNPFNPETVVRYQVAGFRSQKSEVSLRIYDILGREVAVLVDGEKMPGSYTVKWDARGRSSGIYYYQLRADGTVTTKKMVFLR